MEPPHEKPVLRSSSRSQSHKLGEAWGDFLSQIRWEWFVSQTFATNPHPEQAIKYFRRWINELNKSLYGHRWNKRAPFGVIWVMAVEPHKSGEAHLHSVIRGVGETRRLTWMDRWVELAPATGWSRIRPINSNPRDCRYVSKYAAKGGSVYFSDNFLAPGTDPLALEPTKSQVPTPRGIPRRW